MIIEVTPDVSSVLRAFINSDVVLSPKNPISIYQIVVPESTSE
jgi:hypothetical protein